MGYAFELSSIFLRNIYELDVARCQICRVRLPLTHFGGHGPEGVPSEISKKRKDTKCDRDHDGEGAAFIWLVGRHHVMGAGCTMVAWYNSQH